MFEGDVFTAVAPLLDGRRTAENIVRDLSNEFPAEQLWYALFALEQGGFTAEPDPSLPPEQAAFWDSLDVAPSLALEHLKAAACEIREIGIDTGGDMASAFSGMGVEASPAGKRVLVLVDSYLNPNLEAWNREALERCVEWMIAKATGRILWVGPVFRPIESSCWGCLARTLRENGLVEGLPPASLPATKNAGLQMIAVEAAKWFVLGERFPCDAIQTWDFASGGYAMHGVRRQPDCPDCGRHAKERSPISGASSLASPDSLFAAEAGFRICPPADTLERLRSLVSPLTGIVSHLNAVPTDAGQSLVYEAALNIGRYSSYPSVIARGKGISLAQAQVSCLAEAVERYSMLRTGTESVIRSAKTAVGRRALGFDDLLARAFDPAAEIDWVAATAYSSGQTIYVPADYCYVDTKGSTAADSNGCAAGNTLREAMLQGLLELVERDSSSIWWHNRIQRDAVDLESFDDPFLASADRYARRAGCRLHVLDVTTDISIPAFVAVSVNDSNSSASDSVLLGCGAHPDPLIAIGRALTELTQVGAVLGRGHLNSVCTLSDHAHLEPTRCVRTAVDYQPMTARSVEEALNHCVRAVESCGMEVLFVDITRASIGFPVARAIVPGLQGLRPNFSACRLRELPVAMGWLDRPRTPAELGRFTFPL